MINLSDVIDEVKTIAAENPDFVYAENFETCYYQIDGKPACLLGHALFNVGIAAEKLASYDEAILNSFSFLGKDKADFQGTVDELGWLDAVQRNQDNRLEPMSWGESVTLADRDAKDRALV